MKKRDLLAINPDERGPKTNNYALMQFQCKQNNGKKVNVCTD
jgi:hypothetical protein